MYKSVFATSVDQMMQRTKFFECFVCLQQFNRDLNFPMEICERQHFMCRECVQSNLFKKNPNGNGFVCNLCSLDIDKTKIRRSPFLLSIKDFVGELVERQKIRKEKYKECMDRQAQLAEELMNENMLQASRIEELENQIKMQEEMLQGVMEEGLERNNLSLNIQQQVDQYPQVQINVLPKNLLASKIGLNLQEEDPQQVNPKKKLPEGFRSMFREIEQIKSSLEELEELDNENYQKRINQLQKHQSYLYEIIEQEQNA